MRNLVICALILLTLALNCEAIAPVQLGGGNGLSILNQVSSSVQTINTSTNIGLLNSGTIPIGFSLNKTGILGTIPIGYSLNKTGILNPLQTVLSSDFGDWTPSI